MFTVDQLNNRLGVPAGESGTIAYDAAGNLTTDTYGGLAVLRTYDAENRMVKEEQANSFIAGSYNYNADGQRVRRKVNGVETWQVYGMGGELLAEYAANGLQTAPQKEYDYRNGQLLVQATGGASGGTAPSFHDNPLQPGVTSVYALHITELRDAINQVRTSRGMVAAVWLETVGSGVGIKAAHIQEMRDRLDQALGAPSVPYTAELATGKPIKAAHIQELRNRVTAALSALSIQWLVTDQLGTPRMILDQTGSLAGVRRHDYLPFGEELAANTGARSTVPGYVGSDVRQKFTQKERDDETGLDYFEARCYTSGQGRFTSTDPIIMAPERALDPQQINLYQYARNNPLRFTDPTGEDVDDSSLKDNEDYQKWKKAFLATEAGHLQWDKYNNDHSVTITISIGQNAGGKEGAETTPKFDASGKLTGASIVLGTDFAKNAPSSGNYPISSSLTPSDKYGDPISREARAVTFLGHEFGHVEDAQRIGGTEWQRQNQLIEQARGGYNKQGQTYFDSPDYQQVVSQLGDTPVNIGTQREHRAEAYTIPVLRQYFAKGAGHGGMPNRVKQAIQNYQKEHP